MMLIARGITKTYGSLPVLKGIDITIHPGEIVSIRGASGAGKSTLLHVLATLERPDQGTLQIDNQDLCTLQGAQLAAFRNRYIGFVFQFHHLLPELTLFENICLPGYIGGFRTQTVLARAHELVDLLQLTDRMQHKPSELSGGEQQRAAIARALINQPYFVFADEPSGSLDSHQAMQLHHVFVQLRETVGQTFVIVTHNPTLADQADRQLVIQDGQILA